MSVLFKRLDIYTLNLVNNIQNTEVGNDCWLSDFTNDLSIFNDNKSLVSWKIWVHFFLSLNIFRWDKIAFDFKKWFELENLDLNLMHMHQ